MHFGLLGNFKLKITCFYEVYKIMKINTYKFINLVHIAFLNYVQLYKIMNEKTQWRIFLSICVGILLLIPIISIVLISSPNLEWYLIRLAALWGFIGLCLTSLLNLNKKVLYQKFGLKFMKFHHIAAVFSISMATLHPILFAFAAGSVEVFIPVWSPWRSFWELAGRPALILIYIAFIAALFRKKSKTIWKYIHRIMYLAILFLLVHAILIGTDSPVNTDGIMPILSLIVLCLLFLGVNGMAFYLRYQDWQKFKKKKAH